jgi:HEAT repeat
MQSYQKYHVSDFHQDRHPYLDLPFSSEIDPRQVTLAVFFRKIPKLSDCLNFENLPYVLRKDALHTLNELVSHQETKDEMINLSVLQSCAVLLNSESPQVRKESALLIGGLVTLMHARDLLISSSVFPPLQDKLTDPEAEVRTAVAWAIKRILISRDGVDRVVETNTVPKIVSAFIEHAKNPKNENKSYLMELLEAFVNLSQYDNGINPMLDTGLMKCLISFLSSISHLEDFITLQELTLNVICNISVNHTGKAEACEFQAIQAAGEFLKKKSTENQKKLAAAVIMSVSIALEGKYQAVRIEKSGSPVILKRLYKLLLDNIKDIRDNAIQCFHNCSDLPEGFDKSVIILSQNINILDEVFAIKCIKPLARLLPKLSSYADPPRLDTSNLNMHQRCIKALRFLIEKYERGVHESIDTVNISQKLGPFLSDHSGVSDDTIAILKIICSKCSHNKEILKNFVSDYADTDIKKNIMKYPDLIS